MSTSRRDTSEANSAANSEFPVVQAPENVEDGEEDRDNDAYEDELDSEAVDVVSVQNQFNKKKTASGNLKALSVQARNGPDAKLGAPTAGSSTLPKSMADAARSALPSRAGPGPSTFPSTSTSLPTTHQPAKRFAWMPSEFKHLAKFRNTVSFTTPELVCYSITSLKFEI